MSGCDTVSSLAGIGKATVFKKLAAFTDCLCLGDQLASLEEVTESCLRFVATLYGREQGTSLNSMHADIFKIKIAGKCHTPPKLSSLPPTMAAFKLHCQYAHFQTALGCRHVFTPRFGPIAVWLGDEWTGASTSLYPTRTVSCTR